ncbi:MAG: hypothetical protein ACRC9Q_08285 [Bacteroidales bacterium]
MQQISSESKSFFDLLYALDPSFISMQDPKRRDSSTKLFQYEFCHSILMAYTHHPFAIHSGSYSNPHNEPGVRANLPTRLSSIIHFLIFPYPRSSILFNLLNLGMLIYH